MKSTSNCPPSNRAISIASVFHVQPNQFGEGKARHLELFERGIDANMRKSLGYSIDLCMEVVKAAKRAVGGDIAVELKNS